MDISPATRRRPADDAHTWKPLQLFSLYRLVLAGLFVVLALSGNLPPPLGRYDLALFHWVVVGYLLLATAARFAVQRRRPRFNLQVFLQVLLDVVALTLLMHASGGVSSGLGVLLVISVAGGSMLTAGRIAGLFAAMAALAVLAQQVYVQLYGYFADFSYPHAGMLGAAFFATAILAQVLARRLRESEALAAQRGIDLANMAQLTDYVVQQLQTGVVVVDQDGRVRLMNGAARHHLGVEAAANAYLAGIAPELAARLEAWPQENPGGRTLAAAHGESELIPRFVAVGSGPRAGTLILLEDATAAAHQAQQLKLAALGRLTGSIAHEVRNPLGAISHAGELLGESPALQEADHRLIEIILGQSRRVNAIVENVLQLGRRERFYPTDFELRPWLEEFLDEFRAVTGTGPEAIRVMVEPPDLQVRFDPSHLHQVVWNLCQNGLRAAGDGPPPRVELAAGRPEGGNGPPYLEVRDAGTGVPAENVPKLFEPFFTTAGDGTGLGLYIARELAECNGARLEYLAPPAAPTPGTVLGGARFRLSFAATAPLERGDAGKGP